MSATTLTLTLDDDTMQRLSHAAKIDGVSMEVWAIKALNRLVPYGVAEDAAKFQGVHDWTEADRRLAEYDRTGDSVDAADALGAFVAEVKARAAARR